MAKSPDTERQDRDILAEAGVKRPDEDGSEEIKGMRDGRPFRVKAKDWVRATELLPEDYHCQC